ncbi:hypothetical protein [Phenylobacterium sp.]|uniref:hypothetical protein n=1 Tax=Phenylobacterium sp. TaxID=1871053 RepID=UPI002EDA43D7
MDVSDDDLRRYVTGGLGPERRKAVEGFLACNPDLAAKVMTELHLGALRPRKRRRRRLMVAVLAVALGACGASALAGWTAAEHRDLDGWREADGELPPEYVEEAAESRQATLVRAAMNSQVETAQLDVAEIRRTLRLDLPRLPPQWRIVDVQVYPTDEGPSVNVTAQGPGGRRLGLFVVRANTSTTARPELATRGREVVAFWERGESAYVLSGDAPGDVLLSEAAALAAGMNL